MANSAFLPFVIGTHLTDRILGNLRKTEGSFDDFRSKQNQNPKADHFFKLTDYKWIFLKVRSKYSKILDISQSTLYFNIFIHKYTF